MDTKNTNPKAAYGDMKVGLSSVPLGPLYALAVAMAEGGMKYGKHNYRVLGCKHSTYLDAAMGHLAAWWEGEDLDPDSGIHHLIKAAACMFVMYDSILMKNDNDDRPVHYPVGVSLRINEAIGKLKEKYPNPKPPFTAEGASSEDKPGYGGDVENLHCSDCKNYEKLVNHFAPAGCVRGKILTTPNPRILSCEHFERETDD